MLLSLAATKWISPVARLARDDCRDGCDCRGQDLRSLLSPTNGGPIEITLTGTNLADANLAGVDLSGSMLTDCSLRGANLKGAKLDRAMIRGCDLSSADLTEARRDDAAIAWR